MCLFRKAFWSDCKQRVPPHSYEDCIERGPCNSALHAGLNSRQTIPTSPLSLCTFLPPLRREEGLDIPAVDLIVCCDSNASPTRNIQRMGRTGRHRDGRVVYVLTAGVEQGGGTGLQVWTMGKGRVCRCGHGVWKG